MFVSGNPGRTSRLSTVAALKFQRDVRLPYTLNFIRRREILLQQFGLRSPENERRAHDDLFGAQNSRKARTGMLQGLQDPQFMATKEAAEKQLLDAIAQDRQAARSCRSLEDHRAFAEAAGGTDQQGPVDQRELVPDRADTGADGRRKTRSRALNGCANIAIRRANRCSSNCSRRRPSTRTSNRPSWPTCSDSWWNSEAVTTRSSNRYWRERARGHGPRNWSRAHDSTTSSFGVTWPPTAVKPLRRVTIR